MGEAARKVKLVEEMAKAEKAAKAADAEKKANIKTEAIEAKAAAKTDKGASKV